MTSLRARVLGIELYGRQQQESTSHQNHDQDGSRKWPKTAEPEEDQWHETATAFQIDTDPMDPLPAEGAGTSQLMKVAERTQHVLVLRWGTNRRDNNLDGNAKEDGDGDGDGDG